MIKDITLGQFFPINSPLHFADPRIKIILSIAFMVAVFLAKSAYSYAFILLFTILLIFLGRIPPKTVLRGVRSILIIIVITAILNVFWHDGEKVLFSIGKLDIYAEGVIAAVYMIIRVFCLLIGTSVLLSYTTSPIRLTDGLERLLSPLSKLRLPVHEFSMMITIALRFIPTLIEETDKIISAQKSRGASLSSGSLVKRARALLPILIPLFISAFRRADELATAMECRCYRGGEGRTRMNEMKLHPRDLLLTFIFAAFVAGVVLLNRFFPVLVV